MEFAHSTKVVLKLTITFYCCWHWAGETGGRKNTPRIVLSNTKTASKHVKSALSSLISVRGKNALVFYRCSVFAHHFMKC